MSVERFGLDPDGKLGLSADDAVSLPNNSFGGERMVKIERLLSLLEKWAANSNKVDESVWFTEEGRKCEILRTKGGGWKKGRLRIRLEFLPDNPEAFIESSPKSESSPLDDLRSDLQL